MTTLITDGGRYEISKKVADLLRSLFIKQHESEPYYQHQNKAEQRYGVVKRYINTLMNLTGAPADCWLLCMLYVCHLLNATASPALGGLTPLQALTGQVPDISHFLHFSFWEPIYYKVDESEPDHRFPSQSNETRGHWVGFAENKGDQLTWKMLTDDTNTIIIRSALMSATKTSPNLRLDPPQAEDQPQDLTSDVFLYGRPNPDGSDNTPPMSIINFDDLLGRTFLLPMDENGERKKAILSEHVKDLYQQQVSREDQLRFKLIHQTSGRTHHKGRINHKISHLMCLFMVSPILMDLTTHHPCPSLILMTYWGEHFSYLWMRMGRERGLPFLNMSRTSINNKSPEKTSSDSTSK